MASRSSHSCASASAPTVGLRWSRSRSPPTRARTTARRRWPPASICTSPSRWIPMRSPTPWWVRSSARAAWAGASASLGGSSLELPRREALQVDVELVQPRIAAVAGELDLELHLGGLHGKLTDRTLGADARTSPGTVGPSPRELAVSDHQARLLAQAFFVHLAYLGSRRPSQTPDASGSGACRASRKPGGRRFSVSPLGRGLCWTKVNTYVLRPAVRSQPESCVRCGARNSVGSVSSAALPKACDERPHHHLDM